MDKMREAQIASSNQDMWGIYQVVRGLAPKAPRKRTQLRGTQGKLLNQTEEAMAFCDHFGSKFTAVDGWQHDPNGGNPQHVPGYEVVCVESTWLTELLLKAPLRKAVPRAIWRLGADLTAAKTEEVINGCWTCGPIQVPRGWSDAYLVLIRKPGKSGNEPDHHRPIGLQDQVGKITTSGTYLTPPPLHSTHG